MAITELDLSVIDGLYQRNAFDALQGGFDEYREAVKPHLDNAFERALRDSLGSITIKQSDSLLSSLLGGKKIRGTLTCLFCEALGGTLESAIPRATAVEMIHAATLIHDDFVDQDRSRRNCPAVWTLEGARRAVLIGDVIFATAIATMSVMGQDDGLSISKAIAEISKGALHEPVDHVLLVREIESGAATGDMYEHIIRLKTGVLFGAACCLGAIAARADGRCQEASYEYGVRIGEAYQIADDLQDVKKYLDGEPVRPVHMAMLAPALLHFTRNARQTIASLFAGEKTFVEGNLRQPFIDSEILMKKEIENRLKAAAFEIDNLFATRDMQEILRAAPFHIMTMFNKG